MTTNKLKVLNIHHIIEAWEKKWTRVPATNKFTDLCTSSRVTKYMFALDIAHCCG